VVKVLAEIGQLPEEVRTTLAAAVSGPKLPNYGTPTRAGIPDLVGLPTTNE
jgi:hypothetical protein